MAISVGTLIYLPQVGVARVFANYSHFVGVETLPLKVLVWVDEHKLTKSEKPDEEVAIG